MSQCTDTVDMMHSVTDINSFTHRNDAAGAVVVCRDHCEHSNTVLINEAHTVPD